MGLRPRRTNPIIASLGGGDESPWFAEKDTTVARTRFRRGSLRVYPCGLSEIVFDIQPQERIHRRRIAAENAAPEGHPGDGGHLSMDHQISGMVPKRRQVRPNR